MAVFLCATTLSASEKITLLFIGNSFTARHNLPDLVTTLARQGNPKLQTHSESVVYGGRDLFRHWELFKSQDLLKINTLTNEDFQKTLEDLRLLSLAKEPEIYTAYWSQVDASPLISYEQYEAAPGGMNAPANKPRANRTASRWDGERPLIRKSMQLHRRWMNTKARLPAHWDFMVLQSWNDVNPAGNVGFLKYADKFIELAKTQGTKPILYLTAPYSQNSAPAQSPIEPERALAELRILSDFAKKKGALVVPVPLALYRLQKDGAAVTTRYKADPHPNQTCAYLTACLFYAAIFNKSPEGLPLAEVTENKLTEPGNLDPDGGPATKEFTDEERLLLQRTAWETHQAFLNGNF